MYNLTMFIKNIFQSQSANYNDAKPQLLSHQPKSVKYPIRLPTYLLIKYFSKIIALWKQILSSILSIILWLAPNISRQVSPCAECMSKWINKRIKFVNNINQMSFKTGQDTLVGAVQTMSWITSTLARIVNDGIYFNREIYLRDAEILSGISIINHQNL